MELWIRSKNKRQLAKVTGLLLVDNEIRGFTTTKDYYELGTYKTKKRALEVLDEIQNFIIREDELSYVQSAEGIEIQGITEKGIVYNMPKE